MINLREVTEILLLTPLGYTSDKESSSLILILRSREEEEGLEMAENESLNEVQRKKIPSVSFVSIFKGEETRSRK
jgi:hypothetical protein